MCWHSICTFFSASVLVINLVITRVQNMAVVCTLFPNVLLCFSAIYTNYRSHTAADAPSGLLVQMWGTFWILCQLHSDLNYSSTLMYSYCLGLLLLTLNWQLQELYSTCSQIVDIATINNNIYLLQLGCNPVAVVILHVYKTWNCLVLNLSREGYMRSM